MKNRFSAFIFEEKGDNLVITGVVIIAALMLGDVMGLLLSKAGTLHVPGLTVSFKARTVNMPYLRTVSLLFFLCAVIFVILNFMKRKNETPFGSWIMNSPLEQACFGIFFLVWCLIIAEPLFQASVINWPSQLSDALWASSGRVHVFSSPLTIIFDIWFAMALSFQIKAGRLNQDPKKWIFLPAVYSAAASQSLVHIPFLFIGLLIYILFSDFVKSRRVIEALSRMSGSKRETSVSTAMVLCGSESTAPEFQNQAHFDSAVLTRLAKKLGSSSSLKRQVLSFLDELRQVFAIDSTALWIFDQNRNLEFVISRGSGNENTPGLRWHSEFEDSLLNLFSKGEHRILRYIEYPDLQLNKKYDKALFMPVNAAGTTIAILQIEGDTAFGKWDRKLLENLVDQIAINVLNSRISEQVSRISVDLEKREFDYSAMNLLGRITGHTQDVVKIVEFTMAMLVRTLELPCAAIQVINDNNLVLEHADGHICGQNYFYELWDPKASSGKYTFEQGLRVTELGEDKRIELYRSTGKEVTSLYEYSFSLRSGAWSRIGFLSPPDQDEKRNTEFIEFVIPQIKAALDSATVLNNLEQKAGVLKLIYSVCNAMDSGIDYKARIQGVVNVIAQYLETDEFAIFVRKGGTAKVQHFATDSLDTQKMTGHVESIFSRHVNRIMGEPLFMEPMDNLIDDKGLSDFLVTSLVHLGELTGFIVLRETPFSRVESSSTSKRGIKNRADKVDLSLVKALAILTGQLAETYRMQDELRALKEYLSSLMDSLGEAAIAFTSTGHITSINSRSLSLFPDLVENLPEENESSIIELFTQYSEIKKFYTEFLNSLDDSDLASGNDKDISSAPSSASSGSGAGLHRIYENRDTSSQRIFEIHVTAMDKRADNFVSTIRDVTLNVQKEEEIKKIEHLAELGKMAAGIAHEIRNPIGGIKLISTYLQSEFEPDDEKYDMTETIVEGVTSLENKINSLLNYSRPAEPDFKKENLARVIEKALVIYRPEIEEKKMVLKIEATDPENILVSTDSQLLSQVIGNLVKNSIQAMEEAAEKAEDDKAGHPGTILVRTLVDNNIENAVISITDTGPGMTDEELERAFEPFFTSKAQGTGLGLAVSRKIVHALRGSLSFLNRNPEKGLEARLTIPLFKLENKVK